MEKSKLGALLVIISAFGYGTSAIFAKIAYAEGATVFTILAIRFCLAALVIWLMIFFVRQPAKVSFSGLKPLALLSLLGYGGGSTFYFLAVNLLPASLASMLLYTYPVIVALTEHQLYHQQFTPAKCAALFFSSVGLIMILGTTLQGMNMAGVIYGFCAALTYSAYMIYGNKISRDRPPLVSTGYMLLFAAIGFTTYGVFSGSISLHFGPAGWWSIAGLAVFSTALSILALFAGMKWIEAGQASIISTFEPVFTVILAAILFSEIIKPVQVMGGLLVLLAIIFLQFQPANNRGQASS